MPRVRVHQHVNPLAPFYRQAPEPIDLSDLFSDPQKPLHLDIGCARGRFIRRMAETKIDWNFLGVEIREPLVRDANRIAEERGLTNLRYAFCNAMLWLERLLESVPDDVIQMATIHFPDPWFKKKHAKRRMVNPELAETVVAKLAKGGRIFVQTDIEFLAEEMFGIFRSNQGLVQIEIEADPFPIKTERERAVEEKGLPVFRAMFEKI